MRIDAHCHTFNASDLSAEGFITSVLLHIDDLPIRDVEGAARWLVRLVAGAPSAAQELALLESNRASGLALPAAEDATQERLFGYDLAEQLVALVREVEREGAGPEGSGKAELLTGFRTEIAARRGGQPADILADPQGAAEDLLASGGQFGLLVSWIMWMKKYRYQITDRLLATYGRTASDIALFTPAMVDFARWLSDEPESSLQSQIAVGEALVRRYPGRLHPFVAFDPWRQSESPGAPASALALARRAITDHGFIGVKLYPPMGFQAWGNAGQQFPGAAPDLGVRLDQALGALYDWAVHDDVPLMAHCNNSNESAPGYGLRAHPNHWRRVLEQPAYRTLRLNLGHFGGFSDSPTDGWHEQIIGLMRDFDNVYADLGHCGAVLDDARRTDLFNRLEVALGRDPKVAKRLMFGTDWIMVARIEGAERYLETFVAGIGSRFGEPFASDFFGGNAARFLGLRPGLGTWQRLQRFYGATQPSWMGSVVGP